MGFSIPTREKSGEGGRDIRTSRYVFPSSQASEYHSASTISTTGSKTAFHELNLRKSSNSAPEVVTSMRVIERIVPPSTIVEIASETASRRANETCEFTR